MAVSMKTSTSVVARSSSVFTPRVAVPRVGSRVVAAAKAGNWLPGNEAPAYLTDDIPGNYGFDPLELAKEPSSLLRYREAELIHCRWAMLGVAGALAVEVLGFGTWADAPLWAINGGTPTWFGIPVPFDITVITGIEVVAIAIVEGLRNDNTNAQTRLYPGGAFDPLGLAKDPAVFEQKKLKEIKNGRLAMIACLGIYCQNQATGKGPIAALTEHLSSPWTANFATNGVSVPGL